jgi:SpoU rRNA methylase family enzyme
MNRVGPSKDGLVVVVLDELDDVVDILKQAAMDLGRASKPYEAEKLVLAHNMVDLVRTILREGRR